MRYWRATESTPSLVIQEHEMLSHHQRHGCAWLPIKTHVAEIARRNSPTCPADDCASICQCMHAYFICKVRHCCSCHVAIAAGLSALVCNPVLQEEVYGGRIYSMSTRMTYRGDIPMFLLSMFIHINSYGDCIIGSDQCPDAYMGQHWRIKTTNSSQLSRLL